MGRDFLQKLESLREHTDMSPRSDWVQKNRAALLSEIQQRVAPETPRSSSVLFSLQRLHAIFVPQRLAAVSRVALVAILSLGMAMGGWMVTVSASSNSLPSDTLRYGVKLATEKTQVIVAAATGDAASEADLHLTFAARRADELKHISGEPAYADKTASRLRESIASAEQNLESIKEKNPEKVNDVAKKITEKTTDIARDLKDAAGSFDEHAVDGAAAVKDVQNAKKAVQDAGIDAVRVLVKSDVLSGDEVKQLLEKKIGEILSDVEEIKQGVNAVTEKVADAEINASSTTISIAPQSLVASSTTVQTTTIAVSSSTEETQTLLTESEASVEKVMSLADTVGKIGESVEKGQGVVQEVKELLNVNDVDGAIEKVKLLNALTAEIEGVLADVGKTIEENKKAQAEMKARLFAEQAIVVEQAVTDSEKK
ncbi:MAG: hypothetical protein COU33_03285 [Candidatus Magasanikbacteria bacterium CG10_big_fil_rev_8_21_14_0_10_43_6]|uniref:DUF5667 domain-containing protein n=1 Tax=Candidatus Magasanikbacteria bacterium CG10_big_fil_rev_8_21_14_0_10_43_6 TaxID=1974650 RepID=A0A2M6W0X5_9BACT|nr:MAG: hypothetical protein COU33_03285 [Candidatus Magasanikbacteria bacterium CG10_big_fil_rev_8_21_14_0_10_43_6]